MKYDFCGGAYKTFSPNLNAQECVNFIPSRDSRRRVLRGTPGLKDWCDTAKYAEVRGLCILGPHVYAVVGDTVYKIDTDGGATACTNTLDTSSGTVSIAESSSELMIVDGLKGYTVSGTTVTEIADADFPSNPTSVTYQDGYFIVTADGTGQLNISDSNDGTAWDSTYYFNAEADPDDSLKVLSSHRSLVIFGGDTIERWYNSGATVPFDRTPGTTQEVGIGAKDSAVLLANTVYFLTDKFQIAYFEGNTPKVISPTAIDYQIAQYSTKSDAIGMGVTNLEGHTFYVLTFPTANETWGYEVVTKEWFKLTSYPSPYNGRWRGNCYIYFDGKHLVGDYNNGKIYEWDFATYTDNSKTIKRVRTGPVIQQDRKNIFLHTFEIEFEAGVGLTGGVQGEDPQAMLRWSKDGGHTWGNELWRDIGKIGEYENRARWLRNGASKSFNPRLTITDPVKCVIVGATIEARLGAS